MIQSNWREFLGFAPGCEPGGRRTPPLTTSPQPARLSRCAGGAPLKTIESDQVLARGVYADELWVGSRLRALENSVVRLIFLRRADHALAQADEEMRAECAEAAAGRWSRPLTPLDCQLAARYTCWKISALRTLHSCRKACLGH